MHDGRLLRLVEPVQVRHRRIEREEAVERQRRRLAVEHQRPVAAQADPVGIADRRDGGEPVERAAQHDDEHARIAALGAREPRHLASRRTARRRRAAPRGESADGGERSCSPPLEFGRHEQQRQRLLAALGAADRLLHLGRHQRAEHGLDDVLGIGRGRRRARRNCWRCRAAAPGRRSRPPRRPESPSAPADATAARRAGPVHRVYRAGSACVSPVARTMPTTHSLGPLELGRRLRPGFVGRRPSPWRPASGRRRYRGRSSPSARPAPAAARRR